MALIDSTLLTANGSDTNGATFTTASVTPSINKIILVSVYARLNDNASDPDSVVFNGTGLTFELVLGHTHTEVGGDRNHSVWRALGTSITGGTITITYPSSRTNCSWTVSEHDNVDTSGTNGSGAVIQSAFAETVGNSNSLTVTLAAFADTANATYGGFHSGENGTFTEGTGFSIIGQFDGGEAYATCAEFKNTNDTSVDITKDGATGRMIGIALELAAAPVTFLPGKKQQIIGNQSINRASLF